MNLASASIIQSTHTKHTHAKPLWRSQQFFRCRLRYASLCTLFGFWVVSVGLICGAEATAARADCEWPPLNIVEESESQTVVVRDVPFTSERHSWTIAHYHVGHLHCETSIAQGSWNWSFVSNAAQADETKWLLKSPAPASSTLPDKADGISFPALKSLPSLTSAPPWPHVSSELHTLPVLSSLPLLKPLPNP